FRRNFQTAVNRAPQGLGLHDNERQVMAAFLSPRLVIPPSVLALRVGDELEGAVEDGADPRIIGHAIRLPEYKRREPVVVHIALRVGDVEEPRRFGVFEYETERLFEGL